MNGKAALGPGWQQGTVPISGGHLGWHRRPVSGAPVLVFSHGLTDNGLCWSRLAAALPAALDLVLLDARGHGASTRTDPAEPGDPARDIADALNGLGIGRTVLIGHSVGALASADFAARWPEQTCALILEDPPLLPLIGTAELAERRARFCQQVLDAQALDDCALIELGMAHRPPWHAQDLPAWVQAKRQLDPAAWPVRTVRWQDILRRITAPTLLLCGEPARGSLVSTESAAQAARLMPQLVLKRIAGAGHNLRRENLQAFAAAVQAFLTDQLPDITG